MSPEELTAMTRYQIGALKAFVCPRQFDCNNILD